VVARWVAPNVDAVAALHLAEATGLSPVTLRVLMVRDLTSPADIGTFMTPQKGNLLDPFLIKDMERAVDRIQRAVAGGEKVLVFGDYDVDGVSSTALLTETLHELGTDVSYAVPDRLTEGYGLNIERVREAAAAGTNLIVTVDNGVTCHAEIELARELGIDVIVVDHHEPDGNGMPQAAAVLDPKRPDATYPNRDLAAVGVCAKLCQALTGRVPSLDLVALGTVADIVPLRGENRALVSLGLGEIMTTSRPGLECLADVACVRLPQIKAYHIAFFLAPRINAAGRLGCAERAVELMLTGERSVAETIAGELDRVNRERQATEERILGEAIDMAEQSFSPERRTIMLASHNWHTGVVGIVASRIVETYHRPTVLLVIDGEMARGSGRSIPAFDLYSALTECEPFIEKFGGHKYAAGLTVRTDRIELLRQRFEEVAANVLSDDALVPEVRIDTWVEPEEISERLVEEFARIEPCGCGNPRPLLGIENAVSTGPIRAMRNDSARFALRCGERTFPAVAFRMPELYDMLNTRIEIDIAFLPEINVWRGQTEFRLLVRRVRPSRL